MFNQNMEAHNNALYGVDAFMHALQRVTCDHVRSLPQAKVLGGSVLPPSKIYLDATGLPDFPRYIREYYAAVGVIEFFMAWKKHQEQEAQKEAAQEQASDGTVEDRAIEDHVTEFGGDGGRA